MKKRVFVILALLIALRPVFSQDEADFVIAQNKDNTITITGYKGKEKNVVIPGFLHGLRVTAIGKEAFREKDLASVVIPGTVVAIERTAFSVNKRLGEVVIPDSVTSIGMSAFVFCGLSKVTFGRGLQTIGYRAFGSNNLAELVLPGSLKSISSTAFYDNPLESVVIPPSLAKKTGETGIGDGVFGGTRAKIVVITLPAGMDEGVLHRNFGTPFTNFWISQGKVAGTYLKRGQNWARVSAVEAAQYLKELEQARREAQPQEVWRYESGK